MLRLVPIHLLAQQSPPQEEIFDIVVLTPKPPIWPALIWGAVLLLIFAVLGWLIWNFIKSRRSSQPEESPQSRASRRFTQIRRSMSELDASRYTLEVSDTLKDYLAQKFKDPVRFETTEEFLARIAKEQTQLPDAAQQELQSFLVAAEEVKFGNAPDADRRAVPLIKRAENVVNLCQTIN